MERRIRQYAGIIGAILIYYFVHEGAHFLAALYYGAFKTVNFMGIGMQVDIYGESLTDTELGIFCIVGAIATFIVGNLMAVSAEKLCKIKSKLVRAILWYANLTLLLLDPIYLSVLSSFVGGGDMNGIKLILPQMVVRVICVLIFIKNIYLIKRSVLPVYTRSFREE